MDRVTEYKGALFNNIELGEAGGGASFDDKKIKMKGRFSINVLSNSYLYGKELQLQIYGSKDIEIINRTNNNWNRVEIFLPYDKIDELIEALKLAKNYRGSEI